MMNPNPSPDKNHLISALPKATKDRISDALELVTLARGDMLYANNAPVRHIYFPIDTIIALIYIVDTGSSTEFSMIGKEGLTGIFSLLGGECAYSQASVISSGYAFRLPASLLQHEFDQQPETRFLLLRYVQALMTQMAQTAVCNRHHSIEQQLCKLLLMLLDRLPCHYMMMTQELIANTLGVRREGVTEAAGKLQKLGAIDYSRGHIAVLDRHLLAKMSCECYSVLKQETQRLLSFPTAPADNSIHQQCMDCFRYGSCHHVRKNYSELKPNNYRPMA